MHSAPSVSYPVGRSRLLGRGLAALWLGGLVAMVVAWQRVSLEDSQVAVAGAVWSLAGLMAWRSWRAMPQGELCWDGHGWAGPGASSSPAAVRVHLDLHRHLLVHLQGNGAAGQWLWLSADARPARWNDLRRAVYSRAMTDAQRDAAKQ
jgi:toxin CptA